MKKKTIYKYLIILISYFIGFVIGAYGGLVIGGTFFGGLNLYEKIGIETYEVFTYLGALLGLIVISPRLVKIFNRRIKL